MRREQRTRDSGRTPRGQQRTVVRSHVLGPEIIGVERWHGAESTTKAKQDDRVGNRHRSEAMESAQYSEYHSLNSKNQPKSLVPPNPVGHGAPEKAAKSIKHGN